MGSFRNMKVSIVSRSGRTITVLQSLHPNSTVSELQHELHLAKPKFYPSRQRLTLASSNGKPTVLDPKKKLSDYDLTTDCEVVFKDLGPQIQWRTVFIIEYLGPMLIYPLFFLQPQWIYGFHTSEPILVQQIAFSCFMLHYLKREYETIFVHRFGTATMPIRNLFKNSGYYWGNAVICSYFVNHPLYTPPSDMFVYVGLGMWIVGEIGNLFAHFTLRNLRRPGTSERNIPRGGLFELVSCANYTYEIFAWIGWCLMVQSIAAYLFALQGTGQMFIWAKQKHARYRKEFNGQNGTQVYPRNRKALIPFLL